MTLSSNPLTLKGMPTVALDEASCHPSSALVKSKSLEKDAQ
jgi:hypothetical protein